MIPTYNPWFVALSVAIAVVASFTALSLAERVSVSRDRLTYYWLSGGAIAMGIGIWSMHFIGMLAFHLPIPIAYDVTLTLLSIAPAILASGIALVQIRLGKHSLFILILAGIFMGGGIATMHYTGMAAMRMFPPIRYDPWLFVASVLVAVGASIVALEIAFRLQLESDSGSFFGKKVASSMVMGLAIAGMHYTAMAAASFASNSVCLAKPHGITPEVLVVLVTGGSLAVLVITLMLAMFDARLDDQDARMVAELSSANQELHQRAEELAQAMTARVREGARKDRLLAAVVEQTFDAILTTDLEGRVTNWNRAAEVMFGYAAAEVKGRSLQEVISLESAMPFGGDDGGKPGQLHETRGRRRDGRRIYLALSNAPLLNEAKERQGWVNVIRDITRQKEDEERLRQAAAVFESSTEGVIITDSETSILAVNRAFSELTGYSEQEAIGQKAGFTKSGVHDHEFYRAMWQAIDKTGRWRGEIIDRRKNGETYPKWMNIGVVRNDDGEITNYVGVFFDITHLKESERRLQYIAQHDYLTDLPNRLLFEDRLEHAITRARREGSGVALLFVDLDRFKSVNDSLGHLVGDRLLQIVARRICSVVRDEDTVSRLGGDEFTIILEAIEDRQQAARVAEKVISELRHPISINQYDLLISASVGISFYPEDGAEVARLLQHADAAMYKAKEKGRNAFHFFSLELSEELSRRARMEADLRQALERNEFQLYFQPFATLSDGRIVGGEALLRWQHPQQGLLVPGEFLAIAEECGLLGTIEEWVIENACREARRWSDCGMPHLTLAMNLSSNIIGHAGIVDQIITALRQNQLSGNKLQLDVTEAVLTQQTEGLEDNLDALAALGATLSIDDFGTGYSSILDLQRFPVRKLEIGRPFLRNLMQDTDHQALVRAVIALGHSLGLAVSAEGVEEKEQRQFLQTHGCDEIQGYLLSPPLSPGAFIQLLEEKG
jgi:diguanylate cyclase (GGDEF)-like protein/PAS domain S-box-containing protein